MEYENDLDFYVTTATHGPNGQPLTPLFHCAKCNQCLPPAHFKRYMTRAEAKYRGYSGERLVQIETAHCKDCRPRRRTKPESFTTPELKAKAARGEVNEGLVQMIAAQRQRRARAEMRAGIEKRWDLATQRSWEPLLEGVREEVRAVTQQKKHMTYRGNPATRHAVLAYCEGYLDLLRYLRADLTLAMRRAKRKAGPDDRWQDYTTAEQRANIAALWSAIEPNHAHKMRAPRLFSLKNDSILDRPVVPLAAGTEAKVQGTVITSVPPDADDQSPENPHNPFADLM